jgi:hypothetical protein
MVEEEYEKEHRKTRIMMKKRRKLLPDALGDRMDNG